MSLAVVDLFCGCGGLSRGLRDAGLGLRVGVDLEGGDAYERLTGARHVAYDVRALLARDVRAWYGDAHWRVLVGCAPCQTFSALRTTRASVEDARWTLLDEISRIAIGVDAHLVAIENVPRLATHDTFDRFVLRLASRGYHVSYSVVDAAEYGVPQHRRRLIALASRLGPIALPPGAYAGRHSTVRDAIGGLPPIAAGERDPIDPLHRAAGLSPTNLVRIRESRPGGTWVDWPSEIWHSRLYGLLRARPGGLPFYADTYGRLSWDLPAVTLTCGLYNFGSGRFGHPDQDRAISLREGALLQSFSADADFGTTVIAAAARMIGNAVPPLLGRAIGETMISHIGEYAP